MAFCGELLAADAAARHLGAPSCFSPPACLACLPTLSFRTQTHCISCWVSTDCCAGERKAKMDCYTQNICHSHLHTNSSYTSSNLVLLHPITPQHNCLQARSKPTRRTRPGQLLLQPRHAPLLTHSHPQSPARKRRAAGKEKGMTAWPWWQPSGAR